MFDRYGDTPIAANRLLQWGRAMWNDAMSAEKAEVNPWDRIKAHPEAPKDRTLSTAELRRFLMWLPESRIGPASADAWRLILMTGCRPGEIAHAHSSMIDADEQTLVITDTKNGSTHTVFLSTQAWSIVTPRVGDGWLFPSASKTGAPTRVDTVAARLQVALAEWGDLAPFTPHDLRRTMATWLGEQE